MFLFVFHALAVDPPLKKPAGSGLCDRIPCTGITADPTAGIVPADVVEAIGQGVRTDLAWTPLDVTVGDGVFAGYLVAEMDGAGWTSRFIYLTLPHLTRAITVVILIQTIFLLSIYAEIAVTTNGGPGTASTTITYQVALQSLYDNDVGGASAGGIVAVILANIVAVFVMRMIGKNLDA